MRALALLVRRDLRKRPGQAAAMLVMALLAGFLANLGLLLLTSYSSTLDNQIAAWKAPQALAIVHETPETAALVDALHADPGVRQV
ncbi:MAG: hypothetical protein Q4F67_14310, partial [Propionibacteriaceae bacterium]|nr:hypothetical protein [Propionibacteriaceae bacterium]